MCVFEFQREGDIVCLCVCVCLCSDLEKGLKSLKLLVYVCMRSGFVRIEVKSAEMKGTASSEV